MMDEIYKWYWDFGYILYNHNFVVGVLQKIIVKYGARTHSARRYRRVHTHI